MRDPPDTPPGASDPRRGTSLTLLQRLRAKEPDAWQTLVHLYTPLLHHWCARSGIQGADADDILQEVFRAVAAHLDSFRYDRPGDTFRGWLRAISRVALGVAPQSSHRSGRAPFGHPARQVTGSLRAARPRHTEPEVGGTEGTHKSASSSNDRSGAGGRATSATDRAPRSESAAKRPGSR